MQDSMYLWSVRSVELQSARIIYRVIAIVFAWMLETVAMIYYLCK